MNPTQAIPVPVQVEYAEHSAAAMAKKVIPGPLYVVEDSANPGRLKEPTQIAADGEIALELNKAYRVISDGSFGYFLSTVTFAPTNYVFVPANTPVIIASRAYKILTIKNMTGTFVQAAMVQ